jgi:hypothetical protein
MATQSGWEKMKNEEKMALRELNLESRSCHLWASVQGDFSIFSQ